MSFQFEHLGTLQVKQHRNRNFLFSEKHEAQLYANCLSTLLIELNRALWGAWNPGSGFSDKFM